MKRKRQISKEISYKENDNTGLKQQSLSGNQTIDQRNIQPSVAICSVFKRIFDDLDLRPISKYNYVREGQNISTPKTPTCKRRCVLGNDLLKRGFHLQNNDMLNKHWSSYHSLRFRCGFGVKPESKYAFAKKLFDIFIM